MLGACAAHGLQLFASDAPLVVALPALELSEGTQPCVASHRCGVAEYDWRSGIAKGSMGYASVQSLVWALQRCGRDPPLGQPSTAGWRNLLLGRWQPVPQLQRSAVPQHQASSAACSACCAAVPRCGGNSQSQCQRHGDGDSNSCARLKQYDCTAGARCIRCRRTSTRSRCFGGGTAAPRAAAALLQPGLAFAVVVRDCAVAVSGAAGGRAAP